MMAGGGGCTTCVTSGSATTAPGRNFWRMDLGLPEDWETLKAWIQPAGQGYTASQHLEGEGKPLSHPEIPLLADYSGLAPKEFWAAFSSNPLPAGPTTTVRVDWLKILFEKTGPRQRNGWPKERLKISQGGQNWCLSRTFRRWRSQTPAQRPFTVKKLPTP